MAPKAGIVAVAIAVAAYAILLVKKKKEETREAPPPGTPRLPASIKPSNYDLEISPDLDAGEFSGKVTISVDVLESTKWVLLHAAELSLVESSIILKTAEEVLKPVEITLNPEDELLVLRFAKDLPVGAASLHLEFEAPLNGQMKGLYKSTYELEGQQRVAAVTQFEPADARRCFPCWDEPEFKATFAVSVVAPADKTVLSNMPVEEEEEVGGGGQALRRVVFQRSPPMSTYLVALVVGDFEFVEGTTSDGLPVRVYTHPGLTSQGTFSLDVALRTMPFFGNYFGRPYPLPKLDMVAIADFAAGAMENFGLVTYRAVALLVDPENSSAKNKQNVAVTVTHELAHQWFGNLVTMNWWTHLWLNEGFASWVSYLAVDHLFPEWDVWTQFLTQESSRALRLDALRESHPIEVEVGHHRELAEIFDEISYCKGASVIRMLQSFLGPSVFQKGLAVYIDRFAFKNAATEDLWEVLTEVSGQPVKGLMDSWTKQQGYPVITVSEEEQAESGGAAEGRGGSLKVSQERFLAIGGAEALSEGQLWVLPLTLISGSYDSQSTALLSAKTGSVPLLPASSLPAEIAEDAQPAIQEGGGKEASAAVSAPPPWVKLNVRQAGFFRVQYSQALLERLKDATRTKELVAADRLGLLADASALTRACRAPLSHLLSLLEAYETETDFNVVSALVDILLSLSRTISDALPSIRPQFNAFASSLLLSLSKSLGWEVVESESHLSSMLRGVVQSALVSLDHPESVAEATWRFNSFLTNRDTDQLPPDVRVAAYRAVMSKVTAKNDGGIESLLTVYRETQLSEERSRILASLGSSQDPAIIRRALDFSLSPEVRTQDGVYPILGTCHAGRDAAWQWLKDNWDDVFSRWGSTFLIGRFVSAATNAFSSESAAAEIVSFFDAHPHPEISRTVKQSVETVRTSAKLVHHIQAEKGLADHITRLAAARSST